MNLARDVFLVGSSVAAGAINSVAGGGTLLSFPAALAAGLSPVIANATNAVAMTPGSLAAAWSYRGFLGDKRRLALMLMFPSAAGAVAGAFILRHTRPSVFDDRAVVDPGRDTGDAVTAGRRACEAPRVTPGAPSGGEARIDARGDARGDARDNDSARPDAARRWMMLVYFFQFLVGVYGGYFGGAMGIIMLAYLSLLGGMEIHQMNGIKNALAALVNGVASVYFFASGMIDPRAAVLMTAGAIAGGFAGARSHGGSSRASCAGPSSSSGSVWRRSLASELSASRRSARRFFGR